jgi:hypothetical protein
MQPPTVPRAPPQPQYSAAIGGAMGPALAPRGRWACPDVCACRVDCCWRWGQPAHAVRAPRGTCVCPAEQDWVDPPPPMGREGRKWGSHSLLSLADRHSPCQARRGPQHPPVTDAEVTRVSCTRHAPAGDSLAGSSQDAGTLDSYLAGQGVTSGSVGKGSQQDQATGTKAQICFDFTKGLCTRGDKCKFSHDLATIVTFNSKEKVRGRGRAGTGGAGRGIEPDVSRLAPRAPPSAGHLF